MQRQTEITNAQPLLNAEGTLNQAGFARFPLLEYNPEKIRKTPFAFLNRLRMKEWDYYGVFLGKHFFSATVSNIGYLGLVFVYWIDFERQTYIEKSILTPLGMGCDLPKSSLSGDVHFQKGDISLTFKRQEESRTLQVHWPKFADGETLQAELEIEQPKKHEGIVMATPIGAKGFYYNYKLSALACNGHVGLGDEKTETDNASFAALDWGRGVWDYDSFWNWACGFGRLEDGRSIGINLGMGFGDLSHATENAFFIDGRLHKLGRLRFLYDDKNFLAPWRFQDEEGRLDLTLIPTIDRTAKTNLVLLKSEVHQLFGTYKGVLISDDGERISLSELSGWAEEHKARW